MRRIMPLHPGSYWIEQLKMKPHPEGGFFSEQFQAPDILPAGFLPGQFSGTSDGRPLYSSIYFLVTKDSFSAFHRLKSDEMWHFYDGDILLLYLIRPDGSLERKQLGLLPEKEAFPQVLIPGNTWFAAVTTGDFTLCGCTLSPGFHYADLELAKTEGLTRDFPQHMKLIERFTRS